MGSILGGNSMSGGGYNSPGLEQCCDAVVDITSLLTAIGTIGAVSLFLRQAVIDNEIMMARRRKRGIDSNFVLKGTEYIFDVNIFHYTVLILTIILMFEYIHYMLISDFSMHNTYWQLLQLPNLLGLSVCF